MLTKSLLKNLNACQSAIDFCERNRLWNFPLNKIDEIQGDYLNYGFWLKTILLDEIQKYNKKNNLIYTKNYLGYEKWYKYDKRNNLIYYKNSNGYEKWHKYDKRNNLIYYKNSNGYEEWKKYDERNNLVHQKDSNGDEEWNEYDERNNLIHYKNSNGDEKFYIIEYYGDGQLKRYDDLIIPWFEK